MSHAEQFDEHYMHYELEIFYQTNQSSQTLPQQVVDHNRSNP